MLQQDVILQVHGPLTQWTRVLALQPGVDALHVECMTAPGEDLGVVCRQHNTAAIAQGTTE
jgi:hypothetical protein